MRHHMRLGEQNHRILATNVDMRIVLQWCLFVKAGLGKSLIMRELYMHDNMIISLVEILEEKGQILYDERERRMRRKVGQDTTN